MNSYCAAVGLAVESSNIVGYSGVESAEHSAPIVGGMFYPVSGASTYDLRDCTIVGDEGEYCDPGTEFLRFLDPDSMSDKTGLGARYTYCSKEWMDDNFDNPEESYWAIGWWRYDPTVDYQAVIEEDKDDTLMIKAAVNIQVGTAFIGNFSIGHSLRLVSSGEVPLASDSVETANHSAPLIVNYLPVGKTLADITITGGDDPGEYCDPGTEFLRFLDPDSLSDKTGLGARYTYCSKEWMDDNFDNPEECYSAIGWWRYDPTVDYQALIEEDGDFTLKVANPSTIAIPAGSGFVGNFSIGHSLFINFPGAL